MKKFKANKYSYKSLKLYNKKLLIYYLIQQLKLIYILKNNSILIVSSKIYLKYLFLYLKKFKNIFFKNKLYKSYEVDLIVNFKLTKCWPGNALLINKLITPSFSFKNHTLNNYFLPFDIVNIKQQFFFTNLILIICNWNEKKTKS